MGCAGSRPSHLIPSLGNHHHHHHHHTNSPQKGFILFNAKTIEYLQANEAEIKEKLKQRCEQKLTKLIPQSSSSKSLLGNAKRTLFTSNSSSSSASHNNIEGVDVAAVSGEEPILDTNAAFKETAIASAVDYVLKYALYDFDIESFKASNHLSMKQIRKDIMKKNSSVSSLSKLNNSVSLGHNTSATLANHAAKSATLTSRGLDASFYKQALNTAIDEFGMFVQENFIVINEFQHRPAVAVDAAIIADKIVEEELVEPVAVAEEEAGTSNEDEDALKLKEALELARHNFYKGKMSMVCLTKTGGYVVKEVKDQPANEVTHVEGLVILPAGEVSKLEEAPKQEETPREAPKSCSIPTIHIEDVDLIESSQTLVEKAFTAGSRLDINEFLSIKQNLVQVLKDTIESIVNFTTKSGNSELSEKLISNLKNATRVIELLRAVDEQEFEQIDEKLLEAILNLDYVNKEFKSYLEIVGSQQEEQLAPSIIALVSGIEELNTGLPKKLFAAKCLPHPVEASQPTDKKIEIVVQPVEEPATASKKSSPINIRKEIAYSILNVGEVLAKTIDYYSLDSNAEELKNLIELSASRQKISSSPPPEVEVIKEEQLHVDTVEVETGKIDESMEAKQEAAASSGSSLVSPSISSSSSSSLSISPSQKLTVETSSDATIPGEPTTPVPPPEMSVDLKGNSRILSTISQDYDFVEISKSTALSMQVEHSADHLGQDITFMVSQINCFAELDFNDESEKRESGGAPIDAGIKSDAKSSSSSSDILINEELIDSQLVVQQFLASVDEAEAKQNSSVVFRNADKIDQQNKRMSLDEELFYHLEEVDKKVKYMNETCSEDDDDEDEEDDLDDENFDYDESVDIEGANDERLFHPRTPAKIKSQVRHNRTVDLQEEIKQISNVIQDLVQTINVRNNNNSVVVPATYENTSDTNNNADSEDGSQNSGSGGDYKPKSFHYNRNSNGSGNASDRKSLNARRSVGNANSSFNSSIPIRQKALGKQKSTEEAELIDGGSFADLTQPIESNTSEVSAKANSMLNKSTNSQRFKSKLPVKK